MSLLSGGNQCGFVEVQCVSCTFLLNPLHSWVVLCPGQLCTTMLDFPKTRWFFPVVVHEMTDLQVKLCFGYFN